MRILFLTDNFPPEVNAPASRTFEHCRAWVQTGHDVTVITCAPNFPQGKVYPGYRNRWRQVETMDGIRVVRVWSFVTANEGTFRRTLDYLSFMVTGSIEGLRDKRPDVVVGTSPQFFVACAAWFVGRMRRRPFVFELRDLWPESIRAVGALRSAWILRWLERLELYLYRKAALVVAVTESFRDNLVGRGVPRQSIQVVTNGVDLARFAPMPKDARLVDELGLGGKFVLGYVGTHGLAHGLETILDAAEVLLAGDDGDRFAFVMLGDGARKKALQADAARRALRNVVFIDSVPKGEVVRYWSLLDASIIHLSPNPLFETVIPSKLFESMGMGIPVLLGVKGEAARIVTQLGVGLCIEPGNAHELVGSIRKLSGSPATIADFQKACLEAAPQFDRGRLAMSMLESLVTLKADKQAGW